MTACGREFLAIERRKVGREQVRIPLCPPFFFLRFMHLALKSRCALANPLANDALIDSAAAVVGSPIGKGAAAPETLPLPDPLSKSVGNSLDPLCEAAQSKREIASNVCGLSPDPPQRTPLDPRSARTRWISMRQCLLAARHVNSRHKPSMSNPSVA